MLRESRGSSYNKKYSENVRQYALKGQKVVEKGWCKESAATFNLKGKKIHWRTKRPERLCS